jgi:hypothetical protein
VAWVAAVEVALSVAVAVGVDGFMGKRLGGVPAPLRKDLAKKQCALRNLDISRDNP